MGAAEEIDLPENSADIRGLPERERSAGRDPLETIASEFLERLREGETTTVDDFVARHPDLEQEIREFLPLVAAMEDWKANQELEALRRPLPEEFSIARLGECRISREIARGGMGVVFEAEQEPIGRRVAVKMLPWKFSRTSRWGQQFAREARIAARLQHPHIVPVFSFGEDDGRFFYVMQLIEGVSLNVLTERWSAGAGAVSIDEIVKECHPLARPIAAAPGGIRLLHRHAWSQIGKIAAQVISAIRYAHRQGTLHRDIKPGNLMIDIDGKLWVTDFGLALARDHVLAGHEGPLAGTLRYMAPEQFHGTCDERSDLYSFGATLFELCTLQPVFQAASREELLRKVQNANVIAPRDIAPGIPPALEGIILRALEKDLARRYQRADQIQADLLAFLNSRPSPSSRSVWGRVKDWF